MEDKKITVKKEIIKNKNNIKRVKEEKKSKKNK